MSFLLIIQGFLVKLLTGGDDTLVHIPLLGSLFKRRSCKINFLMGMSFSLIIILSLSLLFAGLLKQIPYTHYISAGLLIILATVVYFDLLKFKPKLEQKCEQEVKSNINFQAFLAGLVAFFTTAIDDAIIYSSILLKPLKENFFIILGILIAFTIEIIIIFYFSKQISKLKYTKEITTVVLITLAFLIALQII